MASSYKLLWFINLAICFKDKIDETIDPILARTLLILGYYIFCYSYKGSIVMNKLQYTGESYNLKPALKLMLWYY